MLKQEGLLSGLQKSFQISRYQPRKRISIGTFFGVLALVSYVSFHAGEKNVAALKKDSPQIAQGLQAQLEQVRIENETLKQKLIAADRDLKIQVEAQKNLSQHLKTLEEQNNDLSRDVSLYERIRGVPTTKTEIRIKTFHVFSTQTNNRFRYLLVLGKENQPEQLAQGSVQMTILGRIGSESVELPVRYENSPYQGLAFKLRHFQELSGELSFPDGFVPDTVSFVVKPMTGSAMHQQFPWDKEHIYPESSA